MDNIRGVLVPTDFSPTAWQAILTGIKMAKVSQAPMSLIHVTPYTEDDDYLDEIREKLTKISKNLAAIYNIEINSEISKGDAVVEINRFIKKTEVDFVVMGLNGSGSNEIGSLTDRMLHHLNCPVMVVPAVKKEPVVV